MKPEHKSKLGPIAVGGLGGSGTRVIAEILIKLGFYMGSDLNSASDNLLFTLLFKRPKWFMRKSEKRPSEICRGFSIFEKAMTGRLVPEVGELDFVIRAALQMAVKGHDHLRAGKGMWAIQRAINVLKFGDIDISRYVGWGWKEPNSHIFLEYLAHYFTNLKYIHVIRNGLDMAYSHNQAQLYNWGNIFGIRLNSSMSLPKSSLKYWIAANERAISLGKELLKERFLLINFDRLCLVPEQEITKLINFLGLSTSDVNMHELVTLPKVPSSMGRYMKNDISIFSKDEIEMVKELGFEVNIMEKG